MTLHEFKALKSLEGSRVRIAFADEFEVIARLYDITTDFDESQHLLYDQVEWSSGPHAPNEKGAFYAAGTELVRVAPEQT